MTVSTEVPVAPIENIKTEIDIIPEKPQIESKWQIAKRNVTSSNSGLQPRPRHGHRVVSIRGLILLEWIFKIIKRFCRKCPDQ
jgi:hypothetical protein